MKIKPKFLGMGPINRLRTFSGLWKHRSSLYLMIKDMISGAYKASLLTRIAIVVGILYVLMPFDFIPDFIPVLGWLDDGAIVYFVVRRLMTELFRYDRKQAEKWIKIGQVKS